MPITSRMIADLTSKPQWPNTWPNREAARETIREANAIIGDAHNTILRAGKAFAQPWKSGTVYQKDDVVTWNGDLYIAERQIDGVYANNDPAKLLSLGITGFWKLLR